MKCFEPIVIDTSHNNRMASTQIKGDLPKFICEMCENLTTVKLVVANDSSINLFCDECLSHIQDLSQYRIFEIGAEIKRSVTHT
jgi:hypothetical protein